MGQTVRKAVVPVLRKTQSIEEIKVAEFQKSLADRKALQRSANALSPTPMVLDREINIGVEKQMVQLLPGISVRTVQTAGDSSKAFAEKERISKQPRVKVEDFGQFLMLKAAGDEDFDVKLGEYANERGIDTVAINKALKYVKLHSSTVQHTDNEPSTKNQISNIQSPQSIKEDTSS